ncbi:MAG: molybdenum cofactor biosynthesis protein MoaE [Acidimicrobiia bacterium]|nr:molybdenum cofactor biosynthesis protein MoaE [Acidimicrobiia bacterium]
MSIFVAIVDGPLAAAAPWSAAGAGAVLSFEGVVRPTEDGAEIDALDYDSYRPMAQTMLEELAQEMLASHGLEAVSVEHAVGRVAVGAISFRLRIASQHRVEGLAAATEFISRMKDDVPLFKVPVVKEVST